MIRVSCRTDSEEGSGGGDEREIVKGRKKGVK